MPYSKRNVFSYHFGGQKSKPSWQACVYFGHSGKESFSFPLSASGVPDSPWFLAPSPSLKTSSAASSLWHLPHPTSPRILTRLPPSYVDPMTPLGSLGQSRIIFHLKSLHLSHPQSALAMKEHLYIQGMRTWTPLKGHCPAYPRIDHEFSIFVFCAWMAGHSFGPHQRTDMEMVLITIFISDHLGSEMIPGEFNR